MMQKTEDTVNVFHKMIEAIPEKEGYVITIQTHDIDGWSDMTREEAMHSENTPRGLNGLTTVYYWSENETIDIAMFVFPASFSNDDLIDPYERENATEEE